jgi:hypothetical protein
VAYRVGDRGDCVTVRAFPRDKRRTAAARQQLDVSDRTLVADDQTRIDGDRQPAHPNLLEQKGVG